MSGLTLYTNAMSRGNTVDLFFKILSVPYQRIELGYGADMHTAEYLAINPMGKVPALVDGDNIITETAAICMYLADKFIEKGFAPAFDSPARAAYYRWFLFTAGPVEAAFTAREMGLILNEEQQARSGYGSFERVMACLEKGLTGSKSYLCGNTLTAVDVYIGTFLVFLAKHNLIEISPVVARYIENLALNPEFASVISAK
ncbi:MAG TPA: glutathione S-transferase [Morganella sp. (in: Bacteria)]|nr:glutathione S-transferase [Morganella sp. (in: enterobacteria)]